MTIGGAGGTDTRGMAPGRTADLPPPRAPFTDWPLQQRFAGGYVWLTPHGATLVTQATQSAASSDYSASLIECLEQLAEHGLAERMPNLTILHDWRCLRSIEPSAVATWMARALRSGKHFKHCPSFIACSISPLLRMVLRPAVMANQKVTGQRAAELIEEPEPVLQRLGVRAPDPDFLQRWLAERS